MASNQAADRRPKRVTDSLDRVGHSDEAAVLARHMALDEQKLSNRVHLRMRVVSVATPAGSQFDAKEDEWLRNTHVDRRVEIASGHMKLNKR